jgi:hypothetical protein
MRSLVWSPPPHEAGIAQLVEQLICNQQVIGSNPIAGSLCNVAAAMNAEARVTALGAWFLPVGGVRGYECLAAW